MNWLDLIALLVFFGVLGVAYFLLRPKRGNADKDALRLAQNAIDDADEDARRRLDDAIARGKAKIREAHDDSSDTVNLVEYLRTGRGRRDKPN